MKITVSRSEFADALAWAAQSIASSTSNPALAGVLLKAEGENLTVTGSSSESTTKRRLRLLASEGDATTLIVVKLAEIVRACAGEQVQLTVENGRALIVSGSSRYNLPTLDATDYTEPGAPCGATGTIRGAELQQIINQVAPSASTDQTLPVLSSVLVTVDGNQGHMVATDRYRLAARRFVVEGATPETSIRTLVARTDLVNVARGLGKAESVHLRMTPDGVGTRVSFGAGQSSLTATPVGGEYPSWQTLFPAEFASEIEVEAVPLLEAVKRVGLVLRPDDAVKLTFKAGEKALLEGGITGEDASAQEEIDVDYDGEDLTLALNPKFLADGINAINEQKVVIKANRSTQPIVLQGSGDADETYRYLLMPVRPKG